MNEGKSRGIICQFIDRILNAAASEEPKGWEKRSAIICEIMNFIARQKNAGTRRFPRSFFCSALKKINIHNAEQNFSCEEAIIEGVEKKWIEEAGDEIIITDYGFDYEKDFWKSFR